MHYAREISEIAANTAFNKNYDRRHKTASVIFFFLWFCIDMSHMQVMSSQWCWQTQAPMSLYVRIILEILLQLFNNFQCHA